MRPIHLSLPRIVALLSLVAVIGCRPSSGEDARGLEHNLAESSASYRFKSETHAPHEVSDGAYARFLYVDDAGLCAINIGSIGEQSYNTTLYILAEDCPGPGTYHVASSSEDAQSNQLWGTYLMPSEGSFPQTLTTSGGTLTITKSTADKLHGDFDIALRNAQADAPSATIVGSFRAQRAPGNAPMP